MGAHRHPDDPENFSERSKRHKAKHVDKGRQPSESEIREELPDHYFLPPDGRSSDDRYTSRG